MKKNNKVTRQPVPHAIVQIETRYNPSTQEIVAFKLQKGILLC